MSPLMPTTKVFIPGFVVDDLGPKILLRIPGSNGLVLVPREELLSSEQITAQRQEDDQ